ncbi:MAG: extracellular solute-binding protein [Spirochaetota bacterium]
MKKFLKVSCALLILLLFIQSGWSTGQAEEKEPVKTLTLWYPAGTITVTSQLFSDVPGLFAGFEADNNCVINLAATDYDNMQQKLFAALAANAGPDIIYIDRSWAPGFLKEDALAPVPEKDATDWLKAVSPEIKALSDYGNGKMYGYPQYGIDIYGLTWNKDHFKEAGLDPEKPPTTWNELRDYAKKLTKYDDKGNITRVGYAIRYKGQPHGVVHKHLWAIWGAGADLISDSLALKGGKTVFNNEGGRAALMLVYDMLYVDKSTSLEFPDPRTAFLQGLASMQISETISIVSRQPQEAPALKWGVALPPVWKGGIKPATNLNSWFYSVPAASPNKDLAWKAIKWVNSPEKDYDLCVKFGMTPRYTVNWMKGPFSTDEYAKSLKAMLPYGRAYPNNLALNSIMEALGTAMQKTWLKEADVEKALSEAQKIADAAIEEAAK